MDKGEIGTNRKYKPSLYTSLIDGNAKNVDKVQFIKIVQGNDELLIEARSGNSVIGERVATFTPSDCKNGFLQLEVPNPEGVINRGGVLGYEWEALQLSKATGGALILRHDSGGVALLFFIPAAGSQWIWKRFQPVEIK